MAVRLRATLQYTHNYSYGHSEHEHIAFICWFCTQKIYYILLYCVLMKVKSAGEWSKVT